MSYVEIYKIASSGEVLLAAEVRNATAGALHLWSHLGRRHVDRDYFGFDDGFGAVWKLFRSSKLSRAERLVLGMTFDRVWVARAGLPPLADAIDQVWAGGANRSQTLEGNVFNVHPTWPQVAEALRQLYDEERCRGACFNQTSVESNPWRMRATYEEARLQEPELTPEQFEEWGPYWRPYDFGRDGTLDGKPVVELSAMVASAEQSLAGSAQLA